MQHQQDKNEFAKNIFLFYEQNPNGYKLSDTHRQIISEWAETESEQPQQKNELPERVRKGLNDNVLLEMFDNNKDKLKGFLLICEKAKKGESIVKEANRLKLFDNNTIKKVHDKIYGIFGKKVTGYDNWKTYAEIKR